MELFLKVVYQILSPIQAAQYVVESFPYHCDVLALANVLSTVFGKEPGGGANLANVGQAAGMNLVLGAGPARPGSSHMQSGGEFPSGQQGSKLGGLGNSGLNLGEKASGYSCFISFHAS